MEKRGEYIFSADVVRFLAIIGVVIIHTANSVFDRPDFFGGISWWFAIILNSASRICIPLFIMLSGFLLLKKGESFSVTFKRIVKRLIIPLVFWTTFVYVTSNLKTAYMVFTPAYFLRFFTGDVYYYYYLIILIGLYFVSPLFSTVIRNEKLGYLKNMAIFFIIAGVAETAMEYLVKSCAGESVFTKWVPYLGIFLFGYLVGTGKWNLKKAGWMKWTYLVGFLATVALNYLYYSQGSIQIMRVLPPGCLTHYSDYYLSINVVLMSITAFAFLINLNYKFIKNTIWKKTIYKIARASFGIYLTNSAVITIWDQWLHLDVDSVHIPLWSYVVIKFAAVFTISFILSTTISKIPFLRKTIGEN